MVSPVSGLINPPATTAERDANFTLVANGFQFLNTTTGQIEITYDGGSTWVPAGGAPGGLSSANNLSDVASKDSSQRNLGLTSVGDFISDNLDRVYTTATQPSFINAFYTESGHSIQICPMNETASPTAGFSFSSLGASGNADVDVKDATGAVVFTVQAGKSYSIKNFSNTLGGNLLFLEIAANAVDPASVSSVDFQSSYENSAFEFPTIGNAGFVMTAQEFNVYENGGGTEFDGIASSPSNFGTEANPGVEAAVYRPSKDIYITSLKVWDAHFIQAPGSRVMAVYDRTTQLEYAQGTVLKTGPLVSGYRVYALPRPLFVKANTDFVIAQRYYTGDFYNSAVVAGPDVAVLEYGQSLNTSGIEFPSTFGGVANVAHAGWFDYQVVTPALKVENSSTTLKGPLSINSDALSLGSLNVATAGKANAFSIDFVTEEASLDIPLLIGDTINGHQPSGGLWTQIADGAELTGSAVETDILGAGIGTLSVPANSFQQSSYTLNINGLFSAINSDTLTIRLKSNGSVDLVAHVVDLQTATSKFFKLETTFTIRQIGSATSAVIDTACQFTYNRDAAGDEFVGNHSLASNSTTFDTTVSNTLSVTAQFSSTSASNILKTRLVNLVKVY